MNKSMKHAFLLALSAGFILLGAVGCDKNAISPEDLDNYGGLSIVQFTADKDVPIALKQSITFTFKIEDADEEFDHLVIADGLGNEETLKAAEGTKSITPPATTDYQMHVYAKGENDPRVSTQPLHVEVYDPEHPDTLIITPSVDETPDNKNCSDGVDNDYDTLTDCEDDGCSEDDACVDKYKISYTIESSDGTCHTCEGVENCSCSWASDSEDDQPVYNQGQNVTILWDASSCSNVTLLDESGAYNYYQPAKGSHTATLDVEEKSITLYGLDANEVKQSEQTITIKADIPVVEEPKEYHGSVNISVASSVVYGESFTYSWKITSAYQSASLHFESNEEGGLNRDTAITTATNTEESITIYPADYGEADTVTFTFTLVDDQGLTNTTPITNMAKIGKFIECTNCTQIGKVKQVIPGYNDGLYYVLTTDNKVYKTSDGVSFQSTGISYADDVITIAVDNQDKIYAATSKGIYFERTQISSCCDDGSNSPYQTVHALYAKDENLVFVGTSKTLYKIWPSKEKDCDGSNEFFEHDHCITFAEFGTRSSRDDWYNSPLSITHFIPYLQDAGSVMATSAGGTYIATSGTDNAFTTVLSNDPSPVGGIIDGEDTSYLWTNTDVYSFSPKNSEAGGSFGPSFDSTYTVSGIATSGGMTFVATNKGVYYRFDDGSSEWIFAAIDSPVKAIIKSGSGLTKSVRAVLENGTVYELSWGNINMMPLQVAPLSLNGGISAGGI